MKKRQVVSVETIGGDTNASDELKKMYQADNMPDIFVIEANQAANWDGLLADLTGEAWTEDTDYELVDEKMGTIGFPYTVEATALAYNAEILEKAGVDPASLTSPAAWQKAVETLDSKKDELGLTAVFGWCAEPANLGWSSGTHVFAQYLDAGLAQDDTTYIDLLNDGGKIDEARMKDFAAFVGMMNKYSDPALLIDGTYDNPGSTAVSRAAPITPAGQWALRLTHSRMALIPSLPALPASGRFTAMAMLTEPRHSCSGFPMTALRRSWSTRQD